MQSVTFAAAGDRLAAWYVASRNSAAVILVHGTGAERASLLSETRTLAAAGFGVLTRDLPGQGLSGGETHWGAAEILALSGKIDWLQGRPESTRGASAPSGCPSAVTSYCNAHCVRRCRVSAR